MYGDIMIDESKTVSTFIVEYEIETVVLDTGDTGDTGDIGGD